LSAELILFGVVAVVAVLAALGMLLSRNAVHSALFLVVNFAAVAVLYLMLDAPFISLIQVTVYAGAIMVLFLFVIMLLGVQRLPAGPRLGVQGPLAIGLTAVLLVALGYVVLNNALSFPPGAGVDPAGYTAPESLAQQLFGAYLFPFEVTSILLLVAMIGAVVLTKDERAAPRAAPPREAAGEVRR
jgi:NADH-quinone oxidoreductase subunit J